MSPLALLVTILFGVFAAIVIALIIVSLVTSINTVGWAIVGSLIVGVVFIIIAGIPLSIYCEASSNFNNRNMQYWEKMTEHYICEYIDEKNPDQKRFIAEYKITAAYEKYNKYYKHLFGIAEAPSKFSDLFDTKLEVYNKSQGTTRTTYVFKETVFSGAE